MLYAVVKKELLHHLVSYRFLVSSALLIALAGLATLAGTADYEQRLETWEAQTAEHEQELGQVRVYSYLQPVVLRPPEPLAIFDRGFEDRLGSEVRIHLFSIPTVTGAYRRNPFMASFRNLDLTTIIEVVLGLQALLLTFDAIVGEREQKNLQLVLAQSVRRRVVLAGKFLGAFLSLLGPLLAVLVLSLALVLRSEAALEARDGLRLAGLFSAYAAYLAVMTLLGLLVTLKSRSAPRALALAVLSWFVLVFLLPQTTSAVVGEVTRSSAALDQAVARLEKERDEALARAWEEDPLRTRPSGDLAPVVQTGAHRAVLRRCGSGRFYDSLVRYYSAETALGMDYAERIFALRQARAREERRVERFATIVSSLSPASLLGDIAASFAGTSIDEHKAFFAACRSYRLDLLSFLGEKEAFRSWRWFTDDPDGTRAWPTFIGLEPEDVDEGSFRELFNRFLDPEIQQKLRRELAEVHPERTLDLEGLPHFRFPGTGLGEAGRRAVPEILLLLGLGAVLAVAVWRSFEHYEAG